MGDLSQYIRKIRSNKALRGSAGGLPERVVRHFLKQLASALKFLRSQNLVHRDIKPQNLLLVSAQEALNADPAFLDIPVLKVADFGFARFLPNTSLADTLCGSPLYMGPEILSYKKYDAKADLWSVGAVLYEMITGRPPFRAQNHLELLKKIQENDDRIRFPDEKVSSSDPDRASPASERVVIGSDLKDLIRKLLKKNPVERISFEEFFMHPAVIQDVNSIAYSAEPSRSTSSSSLRPRHSERIEPISKPISDSPSYDPPPFAQASSSQRQGIERRLSRTSSRSSLTRQDSGRLHREKGDENQSRIRKHKVELRETLGETNAIIRRGSPVRRDADEDVLQDYVVLDRRIIETNQFADEVDASPRSVPDRLMGRRHSVGQAIVPRKSVYEQSNQSPPSPGTTPPFAVRERKISTGSAGSALAKALSKASVRLFRASHSPPNVEKLQEEMAGSPRAFITGVGTVDDQESQMMKTIERAACMAHAVAKFADTKFDILVAGRGAANEMILAEEAMVLHIKALSLLEVGLNTAREYWSQVSDEQVKAVSVRLNDAVQWMRDRFNQCLDRASFEGSRCEQEDQNGGGACVEKLLYDRALEMSRAAAVRELVGENISDCEQDYQTAIWLLEAILEIRGDGDVVIEEDDRSIINKFIDSIQHRISVLRKKMEVMPNILPKDGGVLRTAGNFTKMA
ncbi:Serine/threonine-protein kinase [Apophysomyces ossiformis]|uniref:non-specific serine/threonine protein kinase n=1 Tax=Apophysomyces ossiformis TaxID=679940 RepID=A0A8H7ET73_9FUNG|nr:Serine/threonine-protein kinase [Apophysomyces ossiformis]